MNEYTKEELLHKIKTSDEKDIFISLLKETVEHLSDVRNKISNNDSVDLRKAAIEVIENQLLKPLEERIINKKIEEFVDYH
ncbi:hypothetical protein [Methanoculleus sp.]|jgi:putative heme iron utilization protein|uniref:hypothetical protein n=1 Tax=Methanoculleus sp. TaxID=90427 RepID=UPI0025F6DA17|nr:hypothetical protein [Methanoculleus sp.]MCK9319382.1 hypothetical protein [Methanoculleus sp.]